MKLPALARRRQVLVPTVWGWLVLLAAGAAALVMACLHLYSFLAPNEPIGAATLVVEGWMPAEELAEVIPLWRQGRYERVVTSGGPIEHEFECGVGSTYAERAREYLVANGLPADAVIAVPAPASAQDRSFLSAVIVRDWAADAGLELDAIDVFSAGVHARRSRALYRMAFGRRIRIGILAATPSDYDPAAWWRKSVGAKVVLDEAIGWLWTELFFWPGARGSDEERWGMPRPSAVLSTERNARGDR